MKSNLILISNTQYVNTPDLIIGREIETVKELTGGKDFHSDFLANRKANALGKIKRFSAGHGLCFEVEHRDGTLAWYDAFEIATKVY